MRFDKYEWTAITIMISLFILVGFIQGWSVSLVILNMCIISAIMTMGVNISWGYAGVINFGVMGFLAMGGFCVLPPQSPRSKEDTNARPELPIPTQNKTSTICILCPRPNRKNSNKPESYSLSPDRSVS